MNNAEQGKYVLSEKSRIYINSVSKKDKHNMCIKMWIERESYAQ